MRYRALAIPLVGVILALGGFLTYGNLNNNLVYYLTPTEAVSQKSSFTDGQRFRLGGLVEKGSVVRTKHGARFQVEDAEARVPVIFTGAPSQLFGGGIGVVVEGTWRGSTFVSDTMMVKHDSQYKPPAETGPAMRDTAKTTYDNRQVSG